MCLLAVGFCSQVDAWAAKRKLSIPLVPTECVKTLKMCKGLKLGCFVSLCSCNPIAYFSLGIREKQSALQNVTFRPPKRYVLRCERARFAVR